VAAPCTADQRNTACYRRFVRSSTCTDARRTVPSMRFGRRSRRRIP
jgi:hypothetical protein